VAVVLAVQTSHLLQLVLMAVLAVVELRLVLEQAQETPPQHLHHKETMVQTRLVLHLHLVVVAVVVLARRLLLQMAVLAHLILIRVQRLLTLAAAVLVQMTVLALVELAAVALARVEQYQ
jgi:hypothetical protein